MSQEPTGINEPNRASFSPSIAVSWGLGIVGAIVGGCAGWFLFGILYNENFYALALPGALVGLGFGQLSRRPNFAGGIFCAVVATILMLMCEWRYRPWVADESFGYFFSHLHELSMATFLFLILGVGLAFWFGKGT